MRFSGQIKQAKNAIEAARAKEEFASRAILPFALSSLNVYVVRVIEQLVALPSTRDETLVATELPMQDVESIRTCIRYAQATPAKQIAEILKFFPFAFSLPAKIRHWVEAVSGDRLFAEHCVIEKFCLLGPEPDRNPPPELGVFVST